MSADHKIRRTICASTGKRLFHTREGAHSALERIRENYPDTEMSIYRCMFCGGWHFTSQKKNRW